MRVAIVTTASPPDVGGEASWFFGMLAALKAVAKVFALVPDSADPRPVIEAGASAVFPYPTAAAALIGEMGQIIESVSRVAAEQNCDLIQLTSADLAFLVPELDKRGFVVVVTPCGAATATSRFPLSFIGEDRQIWLARNLAAARMVTGTSARDVDEQLFPGVDLERFEPGGRQEARRRVRVDPNGILLLSVGGVRFEDGLLELIEAIGRLALPLTRLIIAGADEGAAERVAAGVRFRGLLDQVILCGQVPPFALADLYRAADVAVSVPNPGAGANQRPQSGMSIVEAAACGIPALVTRTGA
ncbi:MAG: glycosyltransferase family 4 protein, partial [Pseudomonadota bacterium]|nr:glycosyltransferase family 4 protein [Pseudomonadota bacterium]